jgi:hypothetical protein
MASSSVSVQNQVMHHLKTDYNLEGSAAEQIAADAIDLYHRLLTITDFNSFKSIHHQILSSLLIIIRENFELNKSFQ